MAFDLRSSKGPLRWYLESNRPRESAEGVVRSLMRWRSLRVASAFWMMLGYPLRSTSISVDYTGHKQHSPKIITTIDNHSLNYNPRSSDPNLSFRKGRRREARLVR